MPVALRKTVGTYVPETFVKQDAARAQCNALAELFECPLSPGRTRRAHARSMARIDSRDLRGRVVVIRVELVWISVRILHGKLPELAAIGLSGNIGPRILVEEDDFNPHLSAGGDRFLKLLRRSQAWIRIVQREIAVLAPDLPAR